MNARGQYGSSYISSSNGYGGVPRVGLIHSVLAVSAVASNLKKGRKV